MAFVNRKGRPEENIFLLDRFGKTGRTLADARNNYSWITLKQLQ